MTFQLAEYWVWDFWLADDGTSFHMFYLHAPKSLGDPELRHRNARIGHAVSSNLVDWQDRGPIFSLGPAASFDSTATWTGSVVRGPDGIWRMYYTGARFLDDGRNVESIGLATSPDLNTWTKLGGPILAADPRWYEVLGDSSWPEEAWRDPWVFVDPDGEGWHMLLTARANTGQVDDRGVIGHAVSRDMTTWEPMSPLSRPGSGFTHLEVPQLVRINGISLLLFSCDTPKLSGSHRDSGGLGGIWSLRAESPIAEFDIRAARLLAADDIYAGRLAQTRDGSWALLAFTMNDSAGHFGGVISNPMPVEWVSESETLQVKTSSEVE